MRSFILASCLLFSSVVFAQDNDEISKKLLELKSSLREQIGEKLKDADDSHFILNFHESDSSLARADLNDVEEKILELKSNQSSAFGNSLKSSRSSKSKQSSSVAAAAKAKANSSNKAKKK